MEKRIQNTVDRNQNKELTTTTLLKEMGCTYHIAPPISPINEIKPLTSTFVKRLGNKCKLANQILPLFPPHDVYISPFFGTGALFFLKDKVKYNFVNDIDGELFNTYMVLRNKSAEFKDALQNMPIDQNLFKYWKTHQEETDVYKAVRFIFLSNFGYLGKPSSMKISIGNLKQLTLDKFDSTKKLLDDVVITSVDFRKFFTIIGYRHPVRDKKRVMVYADPPYIGKRHNYNMINEWTIKDFKDLIELLIDYKTNFAVSEFYNEDVIKIAKSHNLNILNLKERRNLNDRQVEILITNFDSKDMNIINNEVIKNEQLLLF